MNYSSLWLKPDKSGLYNILTDLKIHNLACLSTSDSSKAFEYKAQTPVTYFLIENSYEPKKNNMSSFKIYDKIENEYINYTLKRDKKSLFPHSFALKCRNKIVKRNQS